MEGMEGMEGIEGPPPGGEGPLLGGGEDRDGVDERLVARSGSAQETAMSSACENFNGKISITESETEVTSSSLMSSFNSRRLSL